MVPRLHYHLGVFIMVHRTTRTPAAIACLTACKVFSAATGGGRGNNWLPHVGASMHLYRTAQGTPSAPSAIALALASYYLAAHPKACAALAYIASTAPVLHGTLAQN
jgi:hypothetical protein